MKITVLTENSACRKDLTPEHGLSLYIEALGRKILFDAGQSAAFSDNADRLGIDLRQVDLAVLSHGHYDHGGGLLRFLEVNDRAPVYLSVFAPEPHWHGEDRYIGLDPALKGSGRLHFVREAISLSPGITLDPAPELPASAGDQGLQVLQGGRLCPEDFRHEQYLLIKEDGTRYLFSGCCHRGAIAIAEHFRPDVFIGGFHLSRIQDTHRLHTAAEALAALPCRYFTGHCTGQAQFSLLKEILGDRLQPIPAGTVLEW